MAGAKEYELIFMLRAQLDSSLRQFSVVGGQIKELDERIQRYNQTLKDIDGYRRRGQSIGTLEQKLRDLESATALVNQRFADSTAKRKAEEAEVQRHKEAVDTLKQAILNEKAAMSQEEAQLRQNGASSKETAAAKKTHQAEIDRLKAKLNEENEALKKSVTALNQAKTAETAAQDAKNRHQKSIDDLRIKIGKEVEKLRQLSEALRKAGVDTTNLDAAEKELRAQLGQTNEEMDRLTAFSNGINTLADQFMVLKMAANAAAGALRPVWNLVLGSTEAAGKLEYSMSAVEAVAGATAAETERMTALVREMGRSTIYTADEAAGAMEKMALAGWDTQQMISGLPAVIKLAAAAGEDLAEMASIVSDGMNAFQLSGETAAVKFADVLAKAATSSNTTVGLLGDSLSYVETTAGNLGYSIEDVATALAAMANNALKGGVSGSALNTTLTRMSGANETAAKAMDELELSMYDANGQAKPLLQFLGELREAFQGFEGDAQKAQVAAYDLAGQRGMRGLLAIVNQSDEQWQKLTADIYDYAGAADQISDIRLDNYEGQLRLMQDAWTDLKITIGNEFLPTARDAAGALTDIIDGANRFAENHGGLVRGLGAATGAAMGLFGAASAAATAIQGIRYAMTTLEVGQLLSVVGGFGGLAAIAGGAGLLAAMLTDGNEAIDKAVPSVRELTEKTRALDDALRSGKKNRDEAVNSAEAAASVAGQYIDRLEELERAGRTTEEQQKEYHDTLRALCGTVPELAQYIDLENDAINGGTAALRKNTEAWKENAKAQAMQEALTEAYTLYGEAVVEARRNELGYTRAVQDQAEAMNELSVVQRRMDELREKGASLTEEEAAEFAALKDREGELGNAIALAREEQSSYNAAAADSQQVLKEAAREMELVEKAAADVSGALETGASAFETTAGALERLEGVYAEAYQAAFERYDAIFGLLDKAESKGTKLSEYIEAQKSQLEWFRNYRDNLKELENLTANYEIDITPVLNYAKDDKQRAELIAAMLEDYRTRGSVEGIELLIGTAKAKVEAEGEIAERDAFDAVLSEIEQAGEDIKKAVEETGDYQGAFDAMQAVVDGFKDGLAAGSGPLTAEIRYYTETWRRELLAGISGGTAATVTAGAMRKFQGYASGTNYAARGLALVGEYGPELVLLHGGERIFPADDSRRIMDDATWAPTVDDSGSYGGGGEITIAPVYNIDAGVDVEALREIFQENNRDLENTVRRVIRSEQIETRRRAFI